MGQAKEFEAVSLFLEEVRLYVEQQNMIDIITGMRHSGIFPTFITNTLRTLPDDMFTLLDNLVAFSFRNEGELQQLAHSRLIDQKSLNTLQHAGGKRLHLMLTSDYSVVLSYIKKLSNPAGGIPIANTQPEPTKLYDLNPLVISLIAAIEKAPSEPLSYTKGSYILLAAWGYRPSFISVRLPSAINGELRNSIELYFCRPETPEDKWGGLSIRLRRG